MRLPGKFNKDEIDIIADSSDLTMNQKDLYSELNEILKRRARFIEMVEGEQRLENVFKKPGNSIAN